MVSAYPCHICGEPGQLVQYDSKHRPIYRCRTSVCDVVEFDQQGVRNRELPPRERAVLPGILRRRIG